MRFHPSFRKYPQVVPVRPRRPIFLILSIWLLVIREQNVAAAALASGSPRNRAHYHPQGVPPEYGRRSVRGSNDLEQIKAFIFGGVDSSSSVLIDGNNVRSFAGFHRLGAIDLTCAVSRWYDRCKESTRPKVSVVWDGGNGPSASLVTDFCEEAVGERVKTVSAAFSGPDESADDIIVQGCCFLDGLRGRIAVFTSDANLGHRCLLQCRQADVRVFHSVYLAWLLEENESMKSHKLGCGYSSVLVSSAHYLTEPDFWERDERREQVKLLQSFLESSTEVSGLVGSGGDIRDIDAIPKWINMGCPGLSVGQVTKIGSMMYAIDRDKIYQQ